MQDERKRKRRLLSKLARFRRRNSERGETRALRATPDGEPGGDNARREPSGMALRAGAASGRAAAEGLSRPRTPAPYDVAERERLLERLEAERRRAEEALRKLSMAVEQSPATVVITDVHGSIEYVNPKFTQLTGYSVEEALGQNPSILKSGRTSPEEYRRMWSTISSGQVWRGEFLNRKKNGELYWESASISPITDAQGVITHFVAVKEDVTARKQAEAERERLLQEVRHQAGQLEDVIRMVSHDLRSPLTAIQGHAQLLHRLLARPDSSDRILRSADAIIANTRRMNAMIQDLVDSARNESGQLSLNWTPLDLRAFILEVKERLAGVMDADRIRVEIPESIPPVPADPDRLERILTNLLSNAVKYSRPQTEVLITAAEAEGVVEVSVVDRGVGIPAEELPRLFERFYRAGGARKAEGLGLGLYITRVLVEAHGGRIRAESQVGHGSTFTFTMPLSQESRE